MNVSRQTNDNIEYLDISTGALWNTSDRDIVTKEFNRIRSESDKVKYYTSWLRRHPEDRELVLKILDNTKARKSVMIKNFETKLERVYNDQTVDGSFEPLFVTKKVDKVVNTGFARIAELIVGESVEFFNAMSCGTGTSTVYTGDTELENELARVSIDVSGYATD